MCMRKVLASRELVFDRVCHLRYCFGSLRSKRFRAAVSEERGFRRFARAKNGARAKIERRGYCFGKTVLSLRGIALKSGNFSHCIILLYSLLQCLLQ